MTSNKGIASGRADTFHAISWLTSDSIIWNENIIKKNLIKVFFPGKVFNPTNRNVFVLQINYNLAHARMTIFRRRFRSN